ncbi:hypothetical protein AMATHDRAFT_49253 [Amanita thiersii Skay4041]|uniref:F-box domain-containing protein n=1 Tax=Amanita thiersii Skay4041 TaxID=703135 RepID=A0A2A9NKH2_9AGAR|nr:hypothetical protein AMATHDRAFT_49253 [Amanita thiersii Skay4041]
MPQRFACLVDLRFEDSSIGFGTYLDLQVFELPWNHLRILHLIHYPFPLSLILKSLRYCTLLEGLSAHVEKNDIESTSTPDIITNSSLLQLELTFIDVETFSTLIHSLLLPNLITLSLNTVVGFLPWTGEINQLLIERFNILNIQYFLAIHASNSSPLLSLLENAHHLWGLELPGDLDLTQEILDGLSMGTVWPRLTYLYGLSCNGSPMLDMIEKRQKIAAQWKKQIDRDKSQLITPLKEVTLRILRIGESDIDEILERIEILSEVWKLYLYVYDFDT